MAVRSAESRSFFDPEAKHAALDERVSNQSRQIESLERSTSAGFSVLGSKLDGLSREMSAGSKTQWPSIWAAMGVCASILVILGGVIYLPIQQFMVDTKASNADMRKDTAASFAAVVANSISRQEMDFRAARGLEDRDKAEKALAIIRDLQVPRSEYDVRLAGVDRDRDNLQRQIDQVRTSLGDTYSLRDFIRDIGSRLDRIEGKRQ